MMHMGTSHLVSDLHLEVKRLEDQRDQLYKALVSATASLAGAESAYRRYANRHHSFGKVEPDPFYSTRIGDFEKAVKEARSVIQEIDNEPQ